MIDIESAIKGILESWGFSIEKIPESTRQGEQTPDFVVKDAESFYILEVKTREDDPAQTAKRNETLQLGALFAEHLPLVRRNTVSGIVRDAYDQLKSVDADNGAFRLAWLVASDRAQDAKSRQFEAALYGTTRMFDLDSAEGVHRPCYFFRNSDFFRYRNVLDAAIVSTLESAKLCLNTLSPRYSSFKQTQLYARFGNAICDPVIEEARGEAYIVDSDVNRNDEAEVMAYLRTKYGSPKLMNIDLGWTSATVSVRNEDVT
jgi:hypothetical protein